MTLTSNNIKVLKSERMTDFVDGGGHMTLNEVVDNELRNVFDSISDLNTTSGNISLRKVFAGVLTDNTDTFYGSNVIISKPPDDPLVNVALFSTKSYLDSRLALQAYLESYLIPAHQYSGLLMDSANMGAQVITIFNPKNDRLAVGKVYAFISNEGEVNEVSEYFSVKSILSSTTSGLLTSSGNAIETVTYALGSPITKSWVGTALSGNPANPANIIRYTTPGTGKKFYSVKHLAANIAIGDRAAFVDSPMMDLVPTSTSLQNIVEQNAFSIDTISVDLGSPITRNFTVGTSDTKLYLGGPVSPTSVSSTGIFVITTTGDGGVYRGGVKVGTIDYLTGIITLETGAIPTAGACVISYTPAAALPATVLSYRDYIGVGQASTTVVKTLPTVPARGSLRVQLIIQGDLYTFIDQGDGTLNAGSAAVGTGQVSYTTGLVSLSLSAKPDETTYIIYLLRSSLTSLPKSATNITRPYIQITLPSKIDTSQLPIFTIHWGSYSATAYLGVDSTHDSQTATPGIIIPSSYRGYLTGDAKGYIDFSNNILRLYPSSSGSQEVISTTTSFTVDYTEITSTSSASNFITDVGTPPFTPGYPGYVIPASVTHTIDVQGAGIIPGTLSIQISKSQVYDYYGSNRIFDTVSNQSGLAIEWFGDHLAFDFQDNGIGGIYRKNQHTTIIGSIDYATGVVVVNLDQLVVNIRVRSFNSYGQYLGDALTARTLNQLMTSNDGRYGWFGLTYRLSGSITTTSHTGVGLSNPTTGNYMLGDLVAKGIRLLAPSFDQSNLIAEFSDDNGNLKWGTNMHSGTSEPVGSFDYRNGFCSFSLNYYQRFSAVTNLRWLYYSGNTPCTSIAVILPGAPFVTGTLNVNFYDIAGTLITLTGTTTAYTLTFLPDQGILTLSANGTGSTLISRAFDPDTLKFSVTSTITIPLPEELLGANSSRLPSDGKVKVFDTGDVVVLHDTLTIAAATYTSSQVVNLGRIRVNAVTVRDALGVIVPKAGVYTTDLVAGTLTFTSVVGLTQPLTIEHRIEDMALITDALLTGKLSLNLAATHAYTSTNSYISGALVMNNLVGRSTTPYDQQTWTGVWSDALIGNSLLANYNSVTYPIIVTNKGAQQERWAVIFDSSSVFRVIGEFVGQIATGDINTDCAPINPGTGVPYFTISAAGWGAGWVAGNVLRFNTFAANYPIDLIRTVKQGVPSTTTDNFKLLVRGNAD